MSGTYAASYLTPQHVQLFLYFSYARLKAAIDDITEAVAAAREERRGVRTGGLGSGGEERREREKEKDKERKRERDTADRDRSEQRYDVL